MEFEELNVKRLQTLLQKSRRNHRSCGKRNPIRNGFHAVVKAVCYRVNIALESDFTVSKFIAVISCGSICEMLVNFFGG